MSNRARLHICAAAWTNLHENAGDLSRAVEPFVALPVRSGQRLSDTVHAEDEASIGVHPVVLELSDRGGHDARGIHAPPLVRRAGVRDGGQLALVARLQTGAPRT